MGESGSGGDLERYRFRIPADGMGRLDSVAAELIDIASRSQLKQRMVSAALNGRPTRLSARVQPGDEVELVVRPEALPVLTPQPVAFDVIHRGSSFAVINKPSGLVVHPAPGHPSGTLVNGLLYHFQSLSASTDGGQGPRPGIVHRLDRDTSGVMVVALNSAGHAALALQFFMRSVEKTYLAVARDRPPDAEGVLRGRLIRDPRNRQRFASGPDNSDAGKPMETRYRVLGESPGIPGSAILLFPATGRTHQLRVQLAHIGCPILGDPIYGGPPAERLMLHALELAFDDPETGERLRFHAPPPRALQRLLPEIPEWQG